MTKHPVALAIALTLASPTALTGCDQTANLTEHEHIQRAKDSEAKGNLKASIIELKNAVQKNPDSAQARLLLGQIYLKAGQGTEAEKEFRHAKALGIGTDALMPLIGEALTLQSEYTRLLDEINLTGNESPINAARILSMRGHSLAGLGKWDKGCELFAQALNADATLAAVYLGLANCAMARNDNTDARRQIDIALQKDPRNAKTWVFLGDFERHNNNPPGAEAAYSEALNIEPSNVAALGNRALTRLSQRQNTQAQGDLNKLQAVAPRSTITKFLEAVFLYQTGEFETSRDQLLQVLQIQPTFLPAQRLLGIVHFKLGNYQEAISRLVRYLEQYPSDLDVRKLLAATYLQLNQPDNSLKVLTPAFGLEEHDSQLLALASAAHLGNHDTSQAISLMQQASALNPTNVALQTQLGLNFWIAGDTQRAQQTLENAASLDRQHYRADLALAVMHLQRQQFEQALSAANNLEQKRPNDPLVYNLKAAAYLGLKKHAEARKNFERVLDLRPNSASAALNLAQLDLRENKSSAARKRFEQILANEKNNIQAMLGLAGMAAGEGNERGYLDWIERAAKVNPPALQPRALLTKYYLDRKQTQKALAVAHEAQTAFPKHPVALELLGTVQLRSGENGNALATFKKLIETSPNAPSAYLNLASAQAADGQINASRASLEKALSLRPDYLEAQLALITLEVRAGKFNDAMRGAQGIKKQIPQSPLGTVLEGDIFMSQGQYAMAAEAYQRAWILGKSGPLTIKRHQALSKAGRTKEADSLLKQWIDAHPDDIDTSLYLARSSAARGDRKQAIKQYEALLKANPSQVIALNNLALLYLEESDPRARTLAEQSYKLESDNPLVADTLGWVLLQQGETKKGAAIIRQAASLDPTNPEIRFHLAAAMAKTGNTAQARSQLKQLLDSGTPFQQREAAQALSESLK